MSEHGYGRCDQARHVVKTGTCFNSICKVTLQRRHVWKLKIEHRKRLPDRLETARGTRSWTSETTKQEWRLQEEGLLRNRKRRRKPFCSLTSSNTALLESWWESPVRIATSSWKVLEKRVPQGSHRHTSSSLGLASVSSHGCLLGHCPRGLSITGLSSHQRRSCCEVTPTLPLATTLHCIP